MIEVEVNGVIHEFPEGTSQDVIRSALQRKYAPPLTPQQQFAKESPVARTIGRTARSAIAGLSSLPDIALLVPKTAALGAGMLAQEMGAEKFGGMLKSIGTTPTMAETSKALIDEATGGRLRPLNAAEKAVDIGGELLYGAAPFAKAPQKFSGTLQADDGVMGAVKSALSPDTAIGKTEYMQTITPKTSEDVRALANQAYQKANQKGGIIKSSVVDNFIDDIQSQIRPKDIVAKQLTKDDPAEEALQIFEENMRGQPMTLDRLQAIDEALTQKIDSYIEFGRPKKEGLGLIKIQDKLRNLVSELGDDAVEGGKEGFNALKEGRSLWSKSAKMRDIERVISRAEMSEQPANAIKSGFRTLYNNPDRMRGYTKEQKEMIKKVADEGIALEALRGVASRLFGIGTAVSGGPAGFVIGKGLEVGARGIRENAMMNRSQNIINDISGFTPQYSPMLSPRAAAALIGTTGGQGTQMIAPPMRQLPNYNSMLRVQ